MVERELTGYCDLQTQVIEPAAEDFFTSSVTEKFGEATREEIAALAGESGPNLSYLRVINLD